MAGYDFVSPGAEGAGQLIDLLAQQEKAKRDKMLDELMKRREALNERNVESEIKTRESTAKRAEAQAAFEMAKAKRIEDAEKAQQADVTPGPSTLPSGPIPSSTGKPTPLSAGALPGGPAPGPSPAVAGGPVSPKPPMGAPAVMGGPMAPKPPAALPGVSPVPQSPAIAGNPSPAPAMPPQAPVAPQPGPTPAQLREEKIAPLIAEAKGDERAIRAVLAANPPPGVSATQLYQEAKRLSDSYYKAEDEKRKQQAEDFKEANKPMSKEAVYEAIASGPSNPKYQTAVKVREMMKQDEKEKIQIRIDATNRAGASLSKLMDPGTKEDLARQLASGVKPSEVFAAINSRGIAGTPLKIEIQNLAHRYNQKTGLFDGTAPIDYKVVRAQTAANQATLIEQTKQLTNMRGFSRTAEDNLDAALKAGNAVARTDSKFVNELVQRAQRNLEPAPALSQFETQVYTAIREYAKLAQSAGTIGASALTDTATREASALLSAAQSPAAMEAAVAGMRIDMRNIIKEKEANVEGIVEAMRSTPPLPKELVVDPVQDAAAAYAKALVKQKK